MIAALFAVDEVFGMGHQGRLSWPSNSDDMKWFKTTTQNQIVVMGRKTGIVRICQVRCLED